jgi:hypothetical protein
MNETTIFSSIFSTKAINNPGFAVRNWGVILQSRPRRSPLKIEVTGSSETSVPILKLHSITSGKRPYS